MTINITAVWDALGWAILHSLWQGALIGFIVWTVRALATERRAWLRYLVGMGGLIATFAAFFATFVLLVFSRLQNQPSVEFCRP
jgi:bla regulator protein BlaR1